jgi:hypothetical protein
MPKKRVLLLVALCGVAAITPAFAQNLAAPFQYSPMTRLMNSGKYRAEVWRRNVATGAEELVWSNSVLHSTATMAIVEACTSLQKYFDVSFSCSRTASQEPISPEPVAQAKATPAKSPAPDGHPNARVTAAPKMTTVERRIAPERRLVSSPSGDYTPSTREFWADRERWRGGGGEGGSGGSGSE